MIVIKQMSDDEADIDSRLPEDMHTKTIALNEYPQASDRRLEPNGSTSQGAARTISWFWMRKKDFTPRTQ
jgi:hypothetical protein